MKSMRRGVGHDNRHLHQRHGVYRLCAGGCYERTDLSIDAENNQVDSIQEDVQGLSDPNLEYLKEKLAQPNAASIVRNGKIKMTGQALKGLLEAGMSGISFMDKYECGGPTYFVCRVDSGVIYEFVYDYNDLLEVCSKWARFFKCDEKLIGFNEISAKEIFDASIQGGLRPDSIQADKIYSSRLLG